MNLAMSHEERARQHDSALALVLELDRIRELRAMAEKKRAGGKAGA
jgi:hypothetical protein